MAEVTVTVSGPVGCGKSAIAGEIEIAMKAIGVPVRYADENAARSEKNMTGGDWIGYIEMYQTTVMLVEKIEPPGALAGPPAWGVWVDYNLAPPGSYACLFSSLVDGKWTEPEARWMPAQLRRPLRGQNKVMPHLMPGAPLASSLKGE